MVNINELLNTFGGLGGFQQKLNLFGQNFFQQNRCTPEQKVQQMLNSGQMTQQQFNALGQIADKLTGRHL